jgi:hypothetical protein
VPNSRISKVLKINALSGIAVGSQTAPSCYAMNTLQAFFSSLAEPTRLALIGASFMVGALLLRKILLPTSGTLDSADKQAAGEASKQPANI